jgi:putative transposase
MQMKYELKSSRHSKHLIHAHLVFTPKYRKNIFTKEHIDFMQSIFEDICKKFEAELIEFDGESNHVHLLVQYPPKVAISSLINSLKGVSSRKLRQHFPVFKKVYWGDKVALWSPSYFAGSVGGAPIEILKQYIEQQDTPH